MGIDNYYERFQIRNKTFDTMDWIEQSINKIEIKKASIDSSGNLEIGYPSYSAVHIFKEKEGPDNAILYTYREDNLKVGDMIVKQTFTDGIEKTENRETFLLFEESPRVDGSKNIRVFSTIEANAVIKESKGGYFPAYFKGEMRSESQIDYSLKGNIGTLDSTALVIVPVSQFQIKNNSVFSEIRSMKSSTPSHFSWEVADKDDITTTGMQYITVKKILKEPSITPEEPKDPSKNYLAAGSVVEVPTKGGFFAAIPNVKVLERKALKVVFEVPNEPGELEIWTKNEEGNEIPTKYTVVI